MQTIKKLFFSTTSMAVLLITLVIVAVNMSVSNISQDVVEQQKILLENAVTRSAVQCYAIEGVYPSDLNYLKDNYNLVYDEEQYVVHYEFIGGNLLPQMSVFYIGD